MTRKEKGRFWKFLLLAMSMGAASGCASVDRDSVSDADYAGVGDYYGYYDTGYYDESHEDDWFYDYYEWTPDFDDVYGYDYAPDYWAWEENDLFLEG